MKLNLDFSSSCDWGIKTPFLKSIIIDILSQEGLPYQEVELSVAIVSDKVSKKLNLEYRHKNKVANVLSFSASPEFVSATYDLGEIIVAASACLTRSREYNESIFESFLFFLVHGLLHLLGWDHQDDNQAELMEKKQEEILKKIYDRF